MFWNRPLNILTTIAFAFLTGVSLSGCTGTFVGVGAAAGTAAMEERGIALAADDTAFGCVLTLYAEDDERLWRKIGFQVYLGRVLLTGVLDTAEMRAQAVRLAWKAEGVVEVINEIELGDTSGLKGYGRDKWIIAQLKSRLLFDKEVSSINYSIDAVRGKVFLIGIAQNTQELDRVLNHARSINYVRKVVSYVRIKRVTDFKS